jgi:hypothetical protein
VPCRTRRRAPNKPSCRAVRMRRVNLRTDRGREVRSIIVVSSSLLPAAVLAAWSAASMGRSRLASTSGGCRSVFSGIARCRSVVTARGQTRAANERDRPRPCRAGAIPERPT